MSNTKPSKKIITGFNLFLLKMFTDELIDNAANYLLSYAKAENGFFSQNVGVGRGATPATANAILALYVADKVSADRLNNLLDELFTFQYSSQAKYAYSFCTEEVSSCWATAKALHTILVINPKGINQSRVVYALKWLVESRNDDFGWGYRKNDPSRPYYTFFATQALAEAWALTTDEVFKKDCEKSLKETHDYIIKSRRKDGLWTNGQGDKACPVNTLMAMATLKLVEPFSPLTPADLQHWPSATFFIKESFTSPASWEGLTWNEPGIAYKRIEPFPPGKIDILLNIFDPFDEVIVFLVGWIRKNVIAVDKNSVGWLPIQAESDKPYSWSTAKCLLGLASFRNQISLYSKVKLHATLQERIGRQWKIVNKRIFTGSIISYAALSSGLYLFIIYNSLGKSFNKFFSQAVEFKDLADSVTSVILLFLPLLFIWAFTVDFIRHGTVNFTKIFTTIKTKIDKIKIE